MKSLSWRIHVHEILYIFISVSDSVSVFFGLFRPARFVRISVIFLFVKIKMVSAPFFYPLDPLPDAEFMNERKTLCG
jgi:hypothetical protein